MPYAAARFATLPPSGHFFERRTERPQVVFADEHDRETIDRGKIERLVEGSLVVCPVAEKTEHDSMASLHSESERGSTSDWNPPAYDTVGAEHSSRNISDVHAAAFAIAIAVRPSQNLRHHPTEIQAASNCVTVTAMRARKEITFPHGCARTHSDGFHANIEVSCPRDKSCFVITINFALKCSDAAHAAIPIKPGCRRDYYRIQGVLFPLH